MWYDVVEQQFELCYPQLGGLQWEAVENMNPHERKTVYGLLVNRKEREKEAYEGK